MTDNNSIIPSLFNRVICFYFSESEHRRFSNHLRQKASFNNQPENLKAQALALLREDMGSFPSEEPWIWDDPEEAHQMEMSMRQMERDILESIEETESYTWGLAITGIYHLWEREARNTIVTLSSLKNSDVERADFQKISKLIRKFTSYRIENSSNYKALRDCNLIANTIKHGEGRAWRELRELRPHLFAKDRNAGLRVGVREFDEASAAIAGFWTECEKAYDYRKNST
jgi:hypothetical protein